MPGGSFTRKISSFQNGQTVYFDGPATLSPFRLDLLEVTVGRFRAFVEAYPASRPKVGAGAHPKIEGSGWSVDYDALMPATGDELRKAAATCLAIPGAATWSNAPGLDERAAVNCIPPLFLAAFCIWDGARLPTFAELQFATLGGDEERPFPWGTEPYDETLALVSAGGSNPAPFHALAGSLPKGAGRWGHRDLFASREEVLMDTDKVPQIDPCIDCAVGIPLAPGQPQHEQSSTAYQASVPPGATVNDWLLSFNEVINSGAVSPGTAGIGARCARDTPAPLN